jgi:hypothetical protein
MKNEEAPKDEEVEVKIKLTTSKKVSTTSREIRVWVQHPYFLPSIPDPP